MRCQCKPTYYRRWLRFDGIDKKKGMPKEAVLEAFRGLQKRLAEISPPSDNLAELAHTTAALLAAEEDRTPDRLSWTQLRTLLVEGIDYVAIFQELGKHSWSEMSETERFFGVPLSIEGPAFSTYRTGMFVAYVGWLTTYLAGAAKGTTRDIRVGRKIQPDMGPSTEQWLGLTFLGEALEGNATPISNDWPRSCVLEKNLLADKDFSDDLLAAEKFVITALGKSRWYYDYDTNAVANVTADGELVPWAGRSVPMAILEYLRGFCNLWCLAAVSNATGSAKGHGMYFTVHRPKVSVRPDATGIDVFIPRFYKYNDIHNYSTKDFRPLWVAMDRVFPSGRLQLRGAIRIEEAKKHMARLIKRGDTPADAWDKTRKKYSWSERTATDYLGPRPKSRPSKTVP